MRDKIVGWPLAIFNPTLPIIADRVALIGDAAGLINPLSGEGIQYALRSGRWIVEALRDATASDSLSAAGLLPYATRVQAEMRYDMAVCRFIVDLASNRALTPLWFWMLKAIARRALSDSGYYNVAAGAFAGVLPAREILSLRFLWLTVTSTATTGCAAMLDGLREPRRLLRSSATAATSVFGHPIATLDWGMHCSLSALEVLMQMATSARHTAGRDNGGPLA